MWKKAKIRNRYKHIPHLTQDTIWESDKTQENITYKRAKRSVFSKQVTTRLQGTNKPAWQARNTNNKKDPQKKHRLETTSKKILEGLNMFDGAAHLTLYERNTGGCTRYP